MATAETGFVASSEREEAYTEQPHIGQAYGILIGDNGQQHNHFHPRSEPRLRPNEAAHALAQEELKERKPDIAELVAFVSGGDCTYCWVVGPPHSGKTMLLASLVARHLPDDVDAVSYFARDCDVNADDFAYKIGGQLRALLGQFGVQPEGSKVAHLIDQALAACRDRHRRLLVVVDGLIPGALPSSESFDLPPFFPSQPHDELRVIVSGGPGDYPPGFSNPRDRPARVRRHAITATPYVRNLKELVERNIRLILAEDGLSRELLGLITAAGGGGLTVTDLVCLTREFPAAVEARLRSGILGKIVRPWREGGDGIADRRELTYEFGHGSYIGESNDNLAGPALDAFRDRIHRWADEELSRQADRSGSDLPGYLLRPYSAMLRSRGGDERLLQLAIRTGRFLRMLAVPGGGSVARLELSMASAIVARTPHADLAVPLILALHRAQLAVPVHAFLPGVWARLGQIEHARVLAGSIQEPADRAAALTSVVEAVLSEQPIAAHVDLVEQAFAAVNSIRPDKSRGEPLLALLRVLGRCADDERIAALIKDSTADEWVAKHAHWHHRVLVVQVEQLIARGEHATATAMLESITDVARRCRSLCAAARFAHRHGRRSLGDGYALAAAALLEQLPHDVAPTVITDVVCSLSKAARKGEARRHLPTVAELATWFTHAVDPRTRIYFLLALIRLDHWEKAESLLKSRGRAVPVLRCRVVEDLATNGMAREAMRVARQFPRGDDCRETRSRAWAAVTASLSRSHSLADARAAASQVEHPRWQVTALCHLILSVPTAAERLRETGEAWSAMSRIPHPAERADALAEIAAALAAGVVDGRPSDIAQRVADLADQAETEMAACMEPTCSDTALSRLAQALAASHHHREAMDTARLILDAVARAEAFMALARQCHSVDTAEPESGATDLRDHRDRYALEAVAALTGSPIRKKNDPRSKPLEALVAELVTWGMFDEAEEAAEAEQYRRSAREHAKVAVLVARAKAGLPSAAAREAETLLPRQKAEALLAIARMPDMPPERADETLHKVRALLATSAFDQQSDLRLQLVELLASRQQLQDAQEAAEGILEARDRTRALRIIARRADPAHAYALAADALDPCLRADLLIIAWSRAAAAAPATEQTAARDCSPDELLREAESAIAGVPRAARPGRWSDLARALDEAGRPVEAQRANAAAYALVPAGPNRDKAIVGRARVLADVGRFEAACRELDMIDDTWQRAKTLTDIADGLACTAATPAHQEQAAFVARAALKAICCVGEDGARDDLLVRIVPILARVGETRAVREATSQAAGRPAQAGVWVGLALARANAGALPQAERLIRDHVLPTVDWVPGPERQAQVLCELALAVRSSDITRALLTRALATNCWSECVHALSVLQPAALLAAAARVPVLISR